MKISKLIFGAGIAGALIAAAGCGAESKTTEDNSAVVKEETTGQDENTTEQEEEEAAEDDSAADEAATFDSETISVAGWNFTVEDVQKSTSLENVSVELGYTGVETSNFKKEASDGKTFCLVKMKIEKDGSKESIDWSNMKVTDGEGNEYTRMEDEFLSEIGMARMPGNTINFGTNEGWIVFEINKDAEDLKLNYKFNEDEYSCNL